MTDKKTLVLLDGSSYLFRAYHALPPLTTSSNMPTGAMYGVINMIRRLINDEKPDYMACVFDTKEKTFRHKMYTEYKANRPEMPEELGVQIKPLHDMIEAMGIPLLAKPGFEADDLIGTLAKQGAEQGLRVVISTGDKDLAQLVNEEVTLINTMTNKVMDIEGVKEKFQVTPEQIIDYLALVGDTSDNVPGVPKVGPKTAAKWLNEYQTLDALVASADKIKGKIGENLRDSLELLKLSKELVTIDVQVPLEVSPDQLIIEKQNVSKLREMFTTYEFKNWLTALGDEQALGGEQAPAKPEVKSQYTCVWDEKTLNAVIKQASEKGLLCFDLETTSLDTMVAEVVGVALCVEPGKAFYVPVAHSHAPQKQLDVNRVLSLLEPILDNDEILKIGQNLKYDIKVLLNYDLKVKGIAFDTMLESYVVNSTATRHDMDSLAQFYLQRKTIKYEDVAGKGAKQIPFADVPVDEACEYACEDADITMQLHEHLLPLLTKEPTLMEVYNTLEKPLIEVLVAMEHKGVNIDAQALKEQSKYLEKRAQELQEKVYELAGEEFNLGSPKQLQKILFEKLELPIIEKTPKGQPSTSESVLVELSKDYELPDLILEYRSLTKLKSTYTDKLPLEISQRDGRIHTNYHQAVTATGRLSSSDPNLQNIPIKTDEGKRIRQAFIAEKGNVILAADYSQVELRIMAHLSGDKALSEAFKRGDDIHSFTASTMFGVPTDKVSEEQRRSAKAINFGLIYGISAFGLAKQLDTTRDVAQEYMDTYFARYPDVAAYMEKVKKTAAQQGYVETMFGRRLYLPEIKASNVARKRAAERVAINAPIQGGNADLIKKAMIDIHHQILPIQGVDMIMQVHDELVFEVKKEMVDEISALVKKAMEQVVELDVPLVVDVGVGDNWQQAH